MTTSQKDSKSWKLGELEFEGLMRMLDNMVKTSSMYYRCTTVPKSCIWINDGANGVKAAGSANPIQLSPKVIGCMVWSYRSYVDSNSRVY